jgi:hypothetical protein
LILSKEKKKVINLQSKKDMEKKIMMYQKSVEEKFKINEISFLL